MTIGPFMEGNNGSEKLIQKGGYIERLGIFHFTKRHGKSKLH